MEVDKNEEKIIDEGTKEVEGKDQETLPTDDTEERFKKILTEKRNAMERLRALEAEMMFLLER